LLIQNIVLLTFCIMYVACACQDGSELVIINISNNVTVTNTVAASYVANTSACAATAANAVAQRKEIKYAEVVQTDLFYPLAFETMGPIIADGHRSSAIWVIESRSRHR